MLSCTQFDHLPDLFFIGLFTYLSSNDVLWAFANVNSRFHSLLAERNLFRSINFSSATLSQFETLIPRLPLEQINTLVINIEASPLQHHRWPYLPSLTTLRLYGLREFDDVSTLIIRHAASLIDLTIETSELFISIGFTGWMLKPRGRHVTLLENVLPHLSALRSLDLGEDTGLGLTHWKISSIRSSLKYLRLPLQNITDLCRVMSTETLSSTLEQLHVTMRSLHVGRLTCLSQGLTLPLMIHLHTFTLVQSIYADSRCRWLDIESVTGPRVMPVLRRVNLAMFVTIDDFDLINGSLLFNDDRRVDVQFAFMVPDVSLGIQLRNLVPHGSYFHRRQVVGVTCVLNHLSFNPHEPRTRHFYSEKYQMAYDVWYTLPWAFGRFFDLPQPLRYITKVEVFSPPSVNPSKTHPSRLDTLTMAQSDSLPSIVSMPGVVQLDRIKTVHLSFHDWPTALNLSGLRHVSLTNNLGALKSFISLPTGIRSIQLLLYANMPNFVSTDWSVLRSLSSLPMLKSLHIVLNDMVTGLDQLTCVILAETVPMLATFAIYFRSQSGMSTPELSDHPIRFDPTVLPPHLIHTIQDIESDDDTFSDSVFDEYRASIEEIRRRILRLPLDIEPLIDVEEEGCGLTIWV